MYLVIGYAIMYGGTGGFLPTFEYFGLGAENTSGDIEGGDAYYSKRADYFFQVVFVATAMSIVSGAVAERMKLWAFLVFAVVMCGVIYPIQGMWTWGGGFLSEGGYSDYAGSGIVHLAGAAAALAAVLLLGPRRGKYSEDGRPPSAAWVQHAFGDLRNVHTVVRLVRIQRRFSIAAIHR